MVKLEDIQDEKIREYFREVNRKFVDLRKYVETILDSRKVINLTLSNRIEKLEKRGGK